MKKMFKIALAYLVFGLFAGIFVHEVSYYTGFTGDTVLSVVHTHALTLGTAVFVMLPVLMKNFDIAQTRSFKRFFGFYNVGLAMTLGFMSARGLSQLFQMPFPNFFDHMVGGMAGIGHVLMTIGFGFLFHALIKSCKD